MQVSLVNNIASCSHCYGEREWLFLTWTFNLKSNQHYSESKGFLITDNNSAQLNVTAGNTHRLGKYHFTAGLQFYKFGFICFAADKNNIFSSLIKSNLVKLETSCTVILPPTVSVVWPYIHRPSHYLWRETQRTLTITVWLTSCLNGLDLTKQAKLMLSCFSNLSKAAEAKQINRGSVVQWHFPLS